MGILRTNTVSGIETPTPVTGSVVFDGSGDYLTLSYSNTNFDWWTASFTIEAWVYASSWSGSSFFPIVGNMEPTSSSNNWSLAPLSTGALRFYYFNGGGVIINSTGTLPAGQWNHIAVTHSSSTIRLFINGVLDTTTTVSGTPQSSNAIPLTIGQYNNTSANGYISNLRILKGTALYTSNFTPPTRELQPIGDTVLLCCNNPDSAGAEATGKAITVNGNAVASTFSPGLVRNFTFGTQFDGVTKFDTQGYFVPPSGTTEQRSRGRGLFGGGYSPSTYINAIEYISISSSGISQDFGDLTSGRIMPSTNSSSVRGLFHFGNPGPGYSNIIDYITIASTGNAQDFGDAIEQKRDGSLSSCSSTTRGLTAGGYASPGVRTNVIDYVTISALGNSVDFGDLSSARNLVGSLSSSTRGVFGGGSVPPSSNIIDYVTIATTGNSITFGNLTVSRDGPPSGCSSSTRGLFGGGSPNTNTIDFITIASTGNAQDFGDLTTARFHVGACSNSNRGVWGGGTSGPNYLNVIDFVTISSTGNAQDFGDLLISRWGVAGLSDSHGGLS